MKKYTHITLNDIAEELSVSKVTVSKALRDHSDIGAEMKKKVRETSERLGYVPNFIARNLSAQKSNTIGLVVPKIAHHFFASAVESIYQKAYEYDYEIIMTVSQEDAKHEMKHIQNLLSMRVDGLLVSITEKTKDISVFETVKKRGVPLVFFDRVLERIGFSTVTTDDEQGSYEAISEIIMSGYNKIAHIAGYSYTNIGKNRSLGFNRAVKDFKIYIPEYWIVEGGFAEADGYNGFMKMYKSGNLPEVIFAVTYPVGLGITVAAQEVGISIPEDLNIITFGGSIYNRFISPSFTYIEQPAEEIATSAIELLFQEIQNPEDTRKSNIVIPTELVFCETCIKK